MYAQNAAASTPITTILSKKNLTNPSKVCTIVVTAELSAAKNALMIPRIILKIDWKTAMIELKVAMMVLTMEAMRLLIDSITEGMIASSRTFDGLIILD